MTTMSLSQLQKGLDRLGKEIASISTDIYEAESIDDAGDAEIAAMVEQVRRMIAVIETRKLELEQKVERLNERVSEIEEAASSLDELRDALDVVADNVGTVTEESA